MVIGTRSHRCLADMHRVPRAERGRAREAETAFAAPTLRQSKPWWAVQHHADAAVYPLCSYLANCESRCLRSVAVRGYKRQGRPGHRQAAVPLYVPSSTQKPEIQGVWACVYTDHNSNTAGLQYQQLL